MPYVEIDQEILDSFDEEMKGKIKLYEPEDTSGLKRTANDLLGEKKRLEADLAEAKAEAKRSKVQQNDGDKDVTSSKLEDALNKIGEWENKYKTLEQSAKNDKLMVEASAIASLITTDPKPHKFATAEVRKYLDLDDKGLVILDDNGNQTVSSKDDLVAVMRENLSFLAAGSKAAGGGALGANGRAVPANTMKRSSFDALSQSGRAEFSLSGGQVVND